jgi:hypothetical protein
VNFHCHENLESQKDYEFLGYKWEVYVVSWAMSEGKAKLSLCLIKHKYKYNSMRQPQHQMQLT